MNEPEEQATVTVPAKTVMLKIGRGPATSRTPQTSGTFTTQFEAVKTELSKKPLRRPNRTRPLE